MFRHVLVRCCFVSVLLLLLLAAGLVQASSWTIPLRIDQPLPDAQPGAPVRVGVPFARGRLLDPATVQVRDSAGRTIAHQQRVLATWDPQGHAGVRWLLLDFCADPGVGYAVVIGDAAEPAQAPQPALVRQVEDRLIVNTGPLQGWLPARGGFNLLEHLQFLGEPLRAAEQSAFGGFYIEHEERGIFRADLDPNAAITVEEAGPIHAVVKADGWYTNEAGEQFGRYSIRVHFFCGRAQVRVDHTFIYTGLSSADRLRSVSVAWPRRAKQRGFIGGADVLGGAVAADVLDNSYFVLDAVDNRHIELLATGLVPDQRVRVADRAGGWMAYDGLTVALRDAWQQFPWEMEVDAGVVRLHLWPRHGRLLDTSFDGQWWFLDEHQKRTLAMQKPKAGADPDAWLAKLRERTNATGAAKTHEFWFQLRGPQAANQPQALAPHLAGLARQVMRPTLALVDPDYAAATLALDFAPHAAVGDPRFAAVDNYYASLRQMIDQLTEQEHRYGWWDWGGYHQHVGGDFFFTNSSFADTQRVTKWHRARPKSHYGWGILPWTQVFRGGGRAWLDYAHTYTRYSADRAHVHHTAHGRNAGAEYHYDNSEIHWMGGYLGAPGGDIVSSNLQHKGDYLAMYWLTGDRRALDVLQMWGEMALALARADPPRWNPAGGMHIPFAQGNEIRNAGMLLHRIMTLYQATWDPRYLELAQPLVTCFAAVTSPQVLAQCEGPADQWKFHQANGWAYEGLWLYWQLTGDQRIRPALDAFLQRAMDFDGGVGDGFGPMRAFTFHYLLTGDTTALDLGRGVLDDLLYQGLTPRNWHPNTLKFTSIALPQLLGALTQAPDSWRAASLPIAPATATLTYRYAHERDPVSRQGARLYLREAEDRAWTLHGVFSHGGAFVLIAPDGRTVAQASLDAAVSNQLRWSVPRDGQTGDYVLLCTGGLTILPNNRNRSLQGRIVQCPLPMVVDAGAVHYAWPTLQNQVVFAHQPAGNAVQLEIELLDRFRPVRVSTANGQVLVDSRDHLPRGDGVWWFELPASTTPRELAIELANEPGRWYASEKTLPRRLMLHGAPAYLAARPGVWFEPRPPAGQPALGAWE